MDIFSQLPPTNNRDPWQNRSDGMRCKSCMWFAPKFPDEGWKFPEPGVIEVPAISIGRCRRHAPTMNGYPVVFVKDWCGDHKLNENWQQDNEAQP